MPHNHLVLERPRVEAEVLKRRAFWTPAGIRFMERALSEPFPERLAQWGRAARCIKPIPTPGTDTPRSLARGHRPGASRRPYSTDGSFSASVRSM